MKYSSFKLELLKMAQKTLEENHKAKVQIAKTAVEAAVSSDPKNIQYWNNYVPKGYGVGDIMSAASTLESFVKEETLLDKIKNRVTSIKMFFKSAKRK
jgi:hypothetical protein